MQVPSGQGVGPQGLLEPGGGLVGEGAAAGRRAGGDDDSQRAGRREALQQGSGFGTFAQVAGDDVGAGAERGEFGTQGVGRFRGGRVRRRRAGDEQEVFGAPAGEMQGDLSADGAGAVGDEHGASGRPRSGGAGVDRRGSGRLDDAAGEEARTADRDVVLERGVAPVPAVGRTVGEGRGEPAAGPAVDPLGQVDRAGPLPGGFQGSDTPECPYAELFGMTDVLGGADRFRAAGGVPHGDPDAALLQGAQERQGETDSSGYRVVLGVLSGGEGHQRQDAGDRAEILVKRTELLDQCVSIRARQEDRLHALGGQRRDEAGDPRVSGLLRGDGEGPGAGRCRRGMAVVVQEAR
ncbi:hypothetical protein NQP46_31105 [Streptomyces albus]|nr:hypothetical protein NQP46_31105 [Streptomyces albus]